MEYIEHAALITVLVSFLLMVLTARVGWFGFQTGAKPYAPSIDDDKDLRIARRIHLNTLEGTVVFLPLLWVGVLVGYPQLTVILGYVWLVARTLYPIAYSYKPTARAPFFATGLLAALVLVGSIVYRLVLG